MRSNLALEDPDTLSFELNLLIIMPLFKKIIETFKVTGEFAGNALSRASQNSAQSAKRATSKAMEDVGPLAKKATEDTQKYAEKIYQRFLADYGPSTAAKFKKAYKQFSKTNPGETGSTIIGGAVGAGIGFAIGGSIGVVGFFGGFGICE